MTNRPVFDDMRGAQLSRRGVLVGLGAALAAPVVLTASGPAAAEDQMAAAEVECLSDLMASGVISRADLLAG